MSDIKIRVGASLESNAASVFQPLIKASERARAAIQSNLNAALKAGGGAGGTKGGVKHNVDALDRELDKMANDILRKEERAQRRRTAAVNEGTRERVRIEKQAAKAIEKAEAAPARQRRSGFWSGGGGAIGIGRRSGMRVPRGVAMAYGYGGAGVSAFARGMGVNTDVGSMMQEGIENQSLAQKIVNSAPKFSDAGAAERQSAAGELEGQAQKIGNATATSTSETLQGLEAFVAKTGDFDTATSTMTDLAKLSKATGTNLVDMANAAAEVSLNLGDVPDKGKVVYDTMRAIAGQGKLGAVEIKDLATQMAKVATRAGMFEGDRGTNIAILGGMAQTAKAHGGAASATQAAQSVVAFASTLTKGATIKAWGKATITEGGKTFNMSPFVDGSKTQLRSPEELILMAMKSTKGDLQKLGKLFPNEAAKRVAGGYADIYRQAGGGEEGLKAIDRTFKEFAAAAMTDADVAAGFASAMATSKSKVQVFNNEMQQASEKLEVALLPAAEALVPVLLAMVGGFSSLMDSDFMKMVLKGGEGSVAEVQKGRGAADRADTNETSAFLTKLGAFAKDNVVPNYRDKNGEWQAPSTAGAAPVIEAGKKELAHFGKELEEVQGRLGTEGKEVVWNGFGKRNTLDQLTPKELEGKVEGGDIAAAKYQADLERAKTLAASQDKVTAALNALTQQLATGQSVVVPRHTAGGAADPNSPPPGH